MQSWYKGVELEKINYYPSDMPAKIAYATDNPKQELIEFVVNNHINPDTGIAFDLVNYLTAGASYPPLPDKYETTADYLQGFRSVAKPGTPFFSLVNDYNANLLHVRVRLDNGEDKVVFIVINRWHDNVTHLFGEDGALDPSKDGADFIEGFVGSYPNYYIDLHERDLPDLLDLLKNYDGSPGNVERFMKYSVNRADDELWETYDWFQARSNSDEPVTSGLFDLNRYYYKAH